METPTNLAAAKLRESGLTPADAKHLHIVTLTAQRTAALGDTFDALPSLQLPYHDAAGRPTGFFRVRYLSQPAGFARHRWHKYTQPPGTAPAAYLPTIGGIDWRRVVKDPSIPLVVTEGELKAAAACHAGIPTIGLGGVYAFRSNRFGFGFLPELEAVVWRQRSVVIVFDSDVATKPEVARALHHLATELAARGAVPSIARLPTMDGAGKTGLDDFLVASGYEAFAAVAAAAEPLAEAKELWAMNRDYVYVANPGLVVELATGMRLRANDFIAHHAADRYYYERTGENRLVKRPLAPAWIRWPFRYRLAKIVYAPGDEPVTEDGALNIWPGWGSAPRAGNCRPWHDLLDYAFDGDAAARRWFLQWLAYPLQHPGEKLYTSVLVWGVEQGCGKSLIGYTIGRIYGENFREIHQADLQSSRNVWAEGCQFALGDEVIGGSVDKRTDIDRLKGLITQQRCVVDQKYVPTFSIDDHANYYFTSQHPGAFYLDDQDRRFFVLSMNRPPLPDAFYSSYDAWYRSVEGTAALFAELLAVDLAGFNPRARAPMTAAKTEMIDDARSDLGDWVAMLRLDPDRVLRLDGQPLASDLWTNAQLLAIYDPDRRTRVTANGLGRELGRAGFARFGRVRTEAHGLCRVYIVRNAERWRRATPTTAARHFDEHFGGGDRPAKF